MRIAVHDYAGHPFVFELSRQLARDGHEVMHLFFEGDPGPKGATQRKASDPDNLSIAPVQIRKPYRKDKMLVRRAQDIEYGRNCGDAIISFKPDIIISGNTPIESQKRLVSAAKKIDSAFVFWMQDFYSLAIRELIGKRMLGAGVVVAAIYERLERSLLRRSDAVVIISDDFIFGLDKINVDHRKFHIINNWGAISEIPIVEKNNPWSRRMGLDSEYVILYSGTLGLKHDPMAICAIADHFATDKSAKVVVSAVGAGFDALRSELHLNPRPNLILNGLEPIENLPDMLGTADAFIALLENDAGRYSVPSKVLSYLCAGRPIILSAPASNLSAKIVLEAGAGRVFEPGDHQALVAAAEDLKRDAHIRLAMGAAGRRYAENSFDIEAIAKRFTSVFEAALEHRHPRKLAPTE
ncbi:MAG: glycosyltransferase family 4 protein [Phenylobacterium sp.]|jgi:glycosyltransferase involved in cell wall biosynthesis|uniref:glycosyltransferase family 4 protein n=1 Tax=Phenylobacterium sp. TaxID=1871053 RepID=UPI002737670B|nr:glycosyltransferase family 4 protein [Phenylobacterium sp.]MDP3116576.1 glycosyltransferase family 4 protein [Phenylobacterium sp.]